MASYRDLGDGRIVAIVRKAGYRPTTRTFRDTTPGKTRKAAQQWASETEAALDRGVTSAHSEQRRRTVADLVAEYKRIHAPTLKPNSVSGFRVALDYLGSHLGARKLADLRPSDLTELRNMVAREPGLRHNQKEATGQRSARTVGRYVTIWRACFRFGTEQLAWITHDANPARNVTKPKTSRGVVRYLSDDEQRRLLRETAKHEALHDAVLVSLWTGQRQQEVLRLRPRDLLRDRIVIRNTKVSLTRELPVTPKCMAVLRRRAKGLQPDDLLWPARRAASDKPLSLRKPWEEALQRAGIRDFRWHDLRHSAASVLVQAGVPLQHVGQLLGHRQASTTMIYAHLGDATMLKTAAKLGSLVKEVRRGR